MNPTANTVPSESSASVAPKRKRHGRHKSPVKRVLLRVYVSEGCKKEILGIRKRSKLKGDTPGKVIERQFGFHYSKTGERIASPPVDSGDS